jgi:putative intracellular protease/amidase
MTAVWTEDISGPVHVLRKNGTVLDVASFKKSFELGKRGSSGAMEGNAS